MAARHALALQRNSKARILQRLSKLRYRHWQEALDRVVPGTGKFSCSHVGSRTGTNQIAGGKRFRFNLSFALEPTCMRDSLLVCTADNEMEINLQSDSLLVIQRTEIRGVPYTNRRAETAVAVLRSPSNIQPFIGALVTLSWPG